MVRDPGGRNTSYTSEESKATFQIKIDFPNSVVKVKESTRMTPGNGGSTLCCVTDSSASQTK